MSDGFVSAGLSRCYGGGQKPRLEYLDCLRGLTMILVVYSHIIILLFNTESLSNNVFLRFRMPLFFFISGYFAYASYTKSLLFRRVKNRLLQQLLPTIVIFALYVFITDSSFKASLLDDSKAGYWFTLVAVELFVTYMALEVVCYPIRKFRNYNRIYSAVLCAGAAISQIAFILCDHYAIFSIRLFTLFSIPYYLKYFPFFFLGILVKKNYSWVKPIMTNGWCMSLIIVSMLMIMDFTSNLGFALLIERILGLVFLYVLFLHYSAFFSSKTKIGKVLVLIGKYTLEIYLLHYIVIYSVRDWKEFFNISLIDSSWLIQLAVYLTLSLIIIGICLLMAKVVRIAPPLYKLMFGRLK